MFDETALTWMGSIGVSTLALLGAASLAAIFHGSERGPVASARPPDRRRGEGYSRPTRRK